MDRRAPRVELQNLRVLVLEDDYFIANDIAGWLRRAGASVVGPVATLSQAIETIECEKLDFAVVDLKIEGSIALDILERLDRTGVPYILSTGYDPELVPKHLAHAPILVKPYEPDNLLAPLSANWRAGESSPSEWRPQNKILSRFSRDALRDLQPHMFFVPMKRHNVLARSNDPIDRVFFPETGVCSLLLGALRKPVEVGIVGREGVIGGHLAIEGVDRNPFHTLVQVPGLAVAIAVKPFVEAVSENSEVKKHLRRYSQALLIQAAYSAASNATQSTEERLARWLLMCADRVGDEVNIVHEHISLMLSVRRAGITTSMHSLEALHAIRSRRGAITILDREILKRVAGWTYGEAEAAYDRLCGD